MKIVTTPQEEELSSSELEMWGLTRGLSIETLHKHGLYIVQDGKYKGMLAIPYPRRSGGYWQTRYRSFEDYGPKYLDEPGADLHMYNPMFLGPWSEEVWFTEGEVDALTMIEAGYPAIGMSGNTKYATPEFQQAFSLLFQGARVYAAVDMDDAGDVAYHDLKDVFPKIRRLQMPQGMDVNEWWLADHKAMKEAIDELRGDAA